ncbi:nuclear transport factor 2 family protein [Microbacterium sp. BWR-S6Y]|uniref:nuclear transport factor 2 family protein n=1 Tax=Microbacterium sp. BWR-S6Y TaxID=3232073 RepID=UPI0035274C72
MIHGREAHESARDCVDRMLAAITAGDLEAAADTFVADARVVRVQYAEGRVCGGAIVAIGLPDVTRWLEAIIARDVSVHRIADHVEGESLVVRTAWSMRGFGEERVHSSSVAVYEVVDGRISTLRATSHDEEGAGRPAARV